MGCGKPLKEAGDHGYGPECKRKRPLDWRSEQRKALAADRASYRIRLGDPPTGKQIGYLKHLAERAGVPVLAVRTKGEASAAIKALLA